jgi:hypothetical protein
MVDTLPLKHCKRRLAATWLIGVGAPFMLLVAQSLLGHFGNSATEVWSWFLASTTPTLGLIVAVLAAEALQRDPGTRRVDRFFYRLSLGFSVLYLLLLSAIILIEPVRAAEGGLPQLIRESGSWLTAMQGLVTASLGVFYVRKV